MRQPRRELGAGLGSASAPGPRESGAGEEGPGPPGPPVPSGSGRGARHAAAAESGARQDVCEGTGRAGSTFVKFVISSKFQSPLIPGRGISARFGCSVYQAPLERKMQKKNVPWDNCY